VTTQLYTGVIEVRCCPVCGIHYGVEEGWLDRKRQTGGSWHCPNGDSLVFTETELDRQKARAERAERQRDSAYRERDREAENAEHARFRARAEKAAKTRLKNRIAKGVCPCCNRHFANVQRHIESQHPDYVASDSTTHGGETNG
jgi:hypothetical protein